LAGQIDLSLDGRDYSEMLEGKTQKSKLRSYLGWPYRL